MVKDFFYEKGVFFHSETFTSHPLKKKKCKLQRQPLLHLRKVWKIIPECCLCEKSDKRQTILSHI